MAKLSQLKQNKVRCLFVCNEHGEITKISDQNAFDNALSAYENNTIVKMFNPTEEQRLTILEMLENNTQEDKVSLNGNIVLDIMNILTDIELDLDGEEAEAVLNEPNDLLLAVNSEINAILFNLVSLQFKNIKDMAKLPPELLEAAMGEVAQQKETKKTAQRKSTKTKK